jgi:dTDP-4-dehydrorhamnose reductase
MTMTLYTGGLYHYSNEGVCSWYDFALEIIRLDRQNMQSIIPIETIDYPTPAVRPHYSLLSKTK